MDARGVVRRVTWSLAAVVLTGVGFAMPAGEQREEEPVGTAAFDTVAPSESRRGGDGRGSGVTDPLETRYRELEEAWRLTQARPKDFHQLEVFQRLMAGFLNETVNIHPDSPWTLKGVELYGAWCQQAATQKSRRDGDDLGALRMLTTAREYFEMIGAEPDRELVEAIDTLERSLD